MIISEEQVRRVAEFLQTRSAYSTIEAAPSTDEAGAAILCRVVDVLRDVPDIRDDRVADARKLLAGTMPSTDAVASKLIGRIISDSLR
ncbi:MAG: hypothetical protein U1F44_02125 [Coriobacteriia bacterium]|nr:hypothetical protein [Coriobacteriia bacterium]